MNNTDHLDELAYSLSSFWKFMLIFALIITGVVSYVNVLGKLNARNDNNILLTAYNTAPPEEERILKILAYSWLKSEAGEWEDGLNLLRDKQAVTSITMDPQIEFRGDGFIELQFTDHVGRDIVFGRPKDGEIVERMIGKSGWAYRKDEMLAVIPASVSRNIDFFTDEIIDWHFEGTDFKYRDYNVIYNQYLGEADSNVSLAFWHCRRFMQETHLFVTLHSDWRQREVIATATLRFRSYHKWRDDYARNEFSDKHDPYMGSCTTIELIDYWEADSWAGKEENAK